MRLIFIAATGLVAFSPALAQQREGDGARLLDFLRDRLERELKTERADNAQENGPGGVVIDFENAPGSAATASLTDQYRQSHGVRFGKGASIQFCSDTYDEFNRSACPYPRAASGQFAALHDVESGGRSMQISFDQPVAGVAAKINPTGGRLDEQFIVQIVGFGADGARLATNSLRFNWYQDAFSWPTEIALTNEKGGAFTRVSIELRRIAQNNSPVRFLIDDLLIANAPERPPVGAAIAEQDGPPRAGRGVIVQSPDTSSASAELQKYPPATRKRLSIDWDAVDADLAEQLALGLSAPSPVRDGQKYVDIAELPVLLPVDPDPGTMMVFGGRDMINAVWKQDGRDYSLYGSRLVTVLRPAEGAPGVRSAVTFSGDSDGLTGSFSLYGASYALTRHCVGGQAADPACFDRDALGEAAGDLVVTVGDAGRGRP